MKRMHRIRKVQILLMKAFAVPKNYYSDFYIIKNSYLRSHKCCKVWQHFTRRYVIWDRKYFFFFLLKARVKVSNFGQFWNVPCYYTYIMCFIRSLANGKDRWPLFHQDLSAIWGDLVTVSIVSSVRHTSVTIGRAPLDCQASVSLCSRSLSDG